MNQPRSATDVNDCHGNMCQNYVVDWLNIQVSSRPFVMLLFLVTKEVVPVTSFFP